MKVSVIIPVYNTSLYLEKCLKSLCGQTLEDIEIICVDDGSVDNSVEILEKFAKSDKRIKIIKQKNQGQSAARNTGIKAAKGEYIGFIDSDDWADEKMFEELYKNAKKFDSDISMCNITIFDEPNEIYYTNDSYMSLDLFNETFENRAFSYEETLDFIFRICVVPWNKIFRRQFLNSKELMFEEGLNFEDNLFNLKTFVEAEKISLTKTPLVFYRRMSKTSYTFNNDYKKLDFFKIFELEEKFLKEKDLYDKIEDYFLETKQNTLIYWYKKLNDEEVKKEYSKLFHNLYPLINLENIDKKLP